MVESLPHPLVAAPPGGQSWRRSWRRFRARHPEAHQELVVLHGLSGAARYLVDGAVHDLRAGSILWAFAGQSHVLLSETAQFDMRVVLISDRVLQDGAAGMPPLRHRPGTALPPRVVGPEASAELETIAASQNATEGEAAQRAGLQWWLARAWAHWQAAPEGAGQLVHPAVDSAARVWRDDPTRSLTQVARQVGLSPGRLGRLFRMQLGQSITAYRTDQKLTRAAQIRAATPRLDLLSVALDAGFGSYAQFYRAWVARHGQPPRQVSVRSGVSLSPDAKPLS